MADDNAMIHRNRPNDRFTIIDNQILQDPEISMDAQGLATYMLSLPSDWKLRPKQIWNSKNIGRNRVYKAFDELIELGYMQRTVENDAVIYRLSAYKEFKDPLPQIRETPLPENGETPLPGFRDTTKTTKTKHNINKVNDRATPSLTLSKEGSKSLDSRKRHANAHLAGLTQEQMDIFEWLKKQGINSHEDTLAWWARTYTLKRLEEVIKEAKIRKARSLGAYMQKILKTGVSVVSGRIEKNKETAQVFKDFHDWNDLEIHQKYATFENGTIEISFDMEPDAFNEYLRAKYEYVGRS